MLMLLAEWLTEHYYSGFNVFQYITFRTILGRSNRVIYFFCGRGPA